MSLIVDRSPKLNHDAIPHVLVDMGPVVQKNLFHLLQQPVEIGDHQLGSSFFGKLGEILEIRKKNADSSLFRAKPLFNDQPDDRGIHGRVERVLHLLLQVLDSMLGLFKTFRP